MISLIASLIELLIWVTAAIYIYQNHKTQKLQDEINRDLLSRIEYLEKEVQ